MRWLLLMGIVVALVLILAWVRIGEDVSPAPASDSVDTTRSADPPGGTGEIDPAIIDRIRSIPYLSWQPIEEASPPSSGTTLHDAERAFRGWNIFNIDGEPIAHLMDMDGRILHSWSLAGDGWHHTELAPRGELLVIVQDSRLMKLDWNSKVLWSQSGLFHHDVTRDAHGNVYALIRQRREIQYAGHTVPILDDRVITLSPDGNPVRSQSLWDLFGEQVPDSTLARIDAFLENHNAGDSIRTYDSLGVLCDIFHANAIEWVDRSIPGVCRPGDLLVSLRQLNLIAFVDIERNLVRWQWGQDALWHQHDPSLLSNGNLLLFDNRTRRESSRVIELDPRTREIVWSYHPKKRGEFFSKLRGASQRLPNGNTLITVSDRGRVLEVTPAGEIVWEFWNEIDARGHLRRAIYRMMRIAPNSKLLPEMSTRVR